MNCAEVETLTLHELQGVDTGEALGGLDAVSDSWGDAVDDSVIVIVDRWVAAAADDSEGRVDCSGDEEADAEPL